MRTAGEDAALEANEPRSRANGGELELRELTPESARTVSRLEVTADQARFVAPNAVSLAEALVEPKAWCRAIVADGRPIGFAMLYLDRDKPEYFLWRFMIAAPFQGRGFGAAAIRLIVDAVRQEPGATELIVFWVPGPGGPEPFYKGLGFVETGVIEDGEVQARLLL